MNQIKELHSFTTRRRTISGVFEPEAGRYGGPDTL